MKNLFFRVLNSLEVFDLFGVSVNFLINKSTKLKSPLSGFISLSTMVTIIVISILLIISWINNANPRIIPSAQNYSVTELLSKNITISHTFTHDNYYAYFSPYLFFPNGSIVPKSNLTGYFEYWYDFLDQTQNTTTIESMDCSVEQMDRFLILDDQTIQNDIGRISEWGVCIKNSLTMGHYPYTSRRVINRTEIIFKLGPCKNSSLNQNHCKPVEQIYEMTKYLKIQTAIPQTFFDFQKGKQMRKRGYNYEVMGIDKSVTKSFINSLVPATMQSDYGLIYEAFQEDFTDYNSGLESFDQVLRSEQDDLFFQYTVYLAYNSNVYFRQNQRVNEVVGSIGGIINIILMISKFICLVYNSFYLRYFLVTNTFSEVLDDSKADSPINKKEYNFFLNFQ